MPNQIVDISEVLAELGLEASCTEKERMITQAALVEAAGAVRQYLKYDPVLQSHTEYYPQNDLRQGSGVGVWEVDDQFAYLRSQSSYSANEIQLKHLPVRSITSLKVDYDGRSGTRAGSFAAAALVEGVGYWPNYDSLDSANAKVCKDGIIKSHGGWPDAAGSVQVVYAAGYTDDELHGWDTVLNASPILEAVKDEAVRRVLKKFSRMKNRFAGFAGPLTSESLGDYSYTSNSEVMSKFISGSDLMPETIGKLSSFVRFDLGVV